MNTYFSIFLFFYVLSLPTKRIEFDCIFCFLVFEFLFQFGFLVFVVVVALEYDISYLCFIYSLNVYDD